MSSLWILPLFLVILSSRAQELDLNVCVLDDAQLTVAKDCLKREIDREVIEDWVSRLSAFGELTELDVIRLVCKENADMGGPIIAGTLADYFGPGEKLDTQLAIAHKCLEASM